MTTSEEKSAVGNVEAGNISKKPHKVTFTQNTLAPAVVGELRVAAWANSSTRIVTLNLLQHRQQPTNCQALTLEPLAIYRGGPWRMRGPAGLGDIRAEIA
eukprot:CAMPEP_0184397038 /NCGR_PEP_ID=MMETSP0007-20130409/57512_1 /TAXON_ID=97485 /ORGANISM="Prymnesium parvum, Strain Texoma1" /LENGTH=99 /DNA_ID=CAMNT_0026750273 /DNA_START=112 /DNA_END=409 /DNA_ORIENTATION=+